MVLLNNQVESPSRMTPTLDTVRIVTSQIDCRPWVGLNSVSPSLLVAKGPTQYTR